MSTTCEIRTPELATKNVPGSISNLNSLPVFSLKFFNFLNTFYARSAISVSLSPSARATLKPPPKLRTETSNNFVSKSSSNRSADFSH
jgi:hypothetical protein